MQNFIPDEPTSNDRENDDGGIDDNNDLERSGWKVYILHLTNLPMTIGILWWVGFGILAYLSPSMVNKMSNNQFYLFFAVPALFLFGLSGLIVIIRNEYVKVRYIYHGSYAFFQGIFRIAFGWGICIYFLFNIFK